MTTLREAAQQALEALEQSETTVRYEGFGLAHREAERKHQAAIATLHAALAQQDEPVREMPSNTRYTVAVEGQALTYWDSIHDAVTNAQRAVYAGVDATTRAIDDLRAGRLAEWSYGFSAVRIYPPQEQAEPVAWLVMDESGYVQHAASWRDAAHEHINDAINEHDLVCARTWRVVPVYTTPSQRKPLTDEEILKAIGWERAEMYMKLTPNFPVAEARKETLKNARAIERAHGIGEQS